MRPIYKVEIMTRPEKLDELKKAFYEIGINGMTISQVYGCGTQKGYTEVYRGNTFEVNMVPKVKIETVICAVPVERLIKVARNILNTGKFGDGKIFVYELANAVRIRTGEEGEKAILDPGEE
jgi:nitrogen regulatory protein P-II 1